MTTRYRLVPPASGVERLRQVYEAVPDDPTRVADCCAHVQRETTVGSRETAREWLAFLQALGCVADGEQGTYRVEPPDDRGTLGRRFRERVFGVREVLSVLDGADDPLTSDVVYDRLDESLRRRLERVGDGAEYVDRLLAWATQFGLVSRRGRGYLLVPESRQ
jgi:hypothetical protein